MRGARWAVLLGIAGAVVSPALAAGQEPSPGTVAVVIATDDEEPGEDQPFVAAVAQALAARLFTVLPGTDHSRFVATVNVRREARGPVRTRASAGRAAVSGPAIAVPLPTKKTVLRDLVATTLTVRLAARGGAATLWSGSGVTVQPEGTRGGDPEAVAAKLARAVLAGYPDHGGETVSVP